MKKRLSISDGEWGLVPSSLFLATVFPIRSNQDNWLSPAAACDHDLLLPVVKVNGPEFQPGGTSCPEQKTHLVSSNGGLNH